MERIHRLGDGVSTARINHPALLPEQDSSPKLAAAKSTALNGSKATGAAKEAAPVRSRRRGFCLLDIIAIAIIALIIAYVIVDMMTHMGGGISVAISCLGMGVFGFILITLLGLLVPRFKDTAPLFKSVLVFFVGEAATIASVMIRAREMYVLPIILGAVSILLAVVFPLLCKFVPVIHRGFFPEGN